MDDPAPSTKAKEGCCCSSLRDLAVVPMGCDGLDERVFETVDIVQNHGGDQWWLYLSKCNVCGQFWMVAQEERIFDDYFLRRLTAEQAHEIIAGGRWPAEFITYERVLKVGKALSQACIFLSPMAASLGWTVEDLRKERPEITVAEIAELIGVTPSAVSRLLEA